MQNSTACIPDHNEFNDFTTKIYWKLHRGEKVKVELRNGSIVTLKWFNDDGPDYEYFCAEDDTLSLSWWNDGRSVNGNKFDMIDIVN